MRLQAIAEDARATVFVSTTSVADRIRQQFSLNPMLAKMPCVAIEDVPDDLADAWREPELDSTSLALLQYTSGSTEKPKGAMASHGNLLHNASRGR